jgi:hypothetical protein
MKTCFEFGTNPYTNDKTKALIVLEQYESKGKLFKVTYGLQVDDKLTYEEACKALGAAILHDLCNEGKADNNGE